MTTDETTSPGDTTESRDEIRRRCQVDGWDGEGSVAVSDAVIRRAESVATAIADLLPPELPGPDFVPEGDGEIGLDWMIDPRRIFSISVGIRDAISYAGQFGGSGSEHGWCPINTSDPAALRESLRHVAAFVSRLYREHSST